ncbi:hypothetical protein [Parageobacillus sp. G301]|uniref:hypothetical protein n=1 Tax=Parageobacillus sp. G301 TaxID=2998290 RepID=UPI002554DE97|nr:hypothetical protein [Parageobacillus sp. G301]
MQYRFFRNQDQQLITEEEALRITEEYIKIGYKNTVANILALKELNNNKVLQNA